MKIAITEHTDRPWRIHEIAPDFAVEDVWALPAHGSEDDFDRLVGQFTRGGDGELQTRGLTGLLFRLRWKLGALLGWDGEDDGIGARVPSLRDRLPADLRDLPAEPDPGGVPFQSVFRTDDEYAAQIANATMTGVLHLGWVPDGSGGYRGQMAVLVKPNGLFGTVYMAAIKPFRYLIVYPAMMRWIERGWARSSR